MGTASKAARDWLRSCDGEEQGLDQTFVLNLLRRTRTTGFRSTGLMNLSKHILRAVRASWADVSGAFSVLCRDRACTASSSNRFVAEFRVYRTRSTEERPKSRAVVSGIQTWEPDLHFKTVGLVHFKTVGLASLLLLFTCTCDQPDQPCLAIK